MSKNFKFRSLAFIAGGSTFNLYVEWRKSVENFQRYGAMNATHLAKNEIGETVT